jgi:hypothetical protein
VRGDVVVALDEGEQEPVELVEGLEAIDIDAG